MSTGIDASISGSPWGKLAGATTVDVVMFGEPEALPPDVALLRQMLDLAAAAHEALRVSCLSATQADPSVSCDVLILWDREPGAPSLLQATRLDALVERATYVIAIGAAVLWLLRTRRANGMRVALHWHFAAMLDPAGDDSIISPAIIEHAGRWTTCCGGAAVIDLGLTFVRDVLGTKAAGEIQDRLCIERIRASSERQRTAPQPAASGHAPKLSEAIALMEANIEEPLQTEEIARLAGVSRRQLERLFRQHLGAVPSRYYMEIRLARAQRLLRESRHSLLQIALMCGFSSGPHFSTAYRTVYGTTPREERQRILRTSAP